jgi:hypothetical protein
MGKIGKVRSLIRKRREVLRGLGLRPCEGDGRQKAVEKRNIRGTERERKRGEFVKEENEMRENKGRESEQLQEEKRKKAYEQKKDNREN